MIIGVDIRCLGEGRRTGVEEYTINLLRSLFELDKKNHYVLFFNSFAKPKTSLDIFKKYKNVKLKIFRYPNKLINFLFWYSGWPKIDRIIGGVDVLFFPNIIFSAWSRKTKAIFTIHDLSFKRYPETFSLKRKLWHWFINPRKLCRRADLITTVSQSSRNDLMKLYGISGDKIKVIRSAVSEEFSVIDRNNPGLMKVKEKYGLPYKFILYLGTIEPRKNIVGIVQAYNHLRKDDNPELNKHKLVVAGAPGWKQEKILEEIKKSPFREDIIIAGFINGEDKPAVYNLASLFVYPSFFEGFGFPPLEAMKCGVPVIVSNNSSLPEIIGKAGILIDPDKPDEIYRAMKEILSNKDLQRKLREKGLIQAQKFNWQKTAREFLNLVEKML